jgi:hypothetical protein
MPFATACRPLAPDVRDVERRERARLGRAADRGSPICRGWSKAPRRGAEASVAFFPAVSVGRAHAAQRSATPAAFSSASADTTAADLTGAVFEGVALAFADGLDVLVERAAPSATSRHRWGRALALLGRAAGRGAESSDDLSAGWRSGRGAWARRAWRVSLSVRRKTGGCLRGASRRARGAARCRPGCAVGRLAAAPSCGCMRISRALLWSIQHEPVFKR